MSEIVYEVKNKTYITGRSRQEDGNYEEVANMQVNDDEENMDEVLRSMNSANRYSEPANAPNESTVATATASMTGFSIDLSFY